MLVYKQASLSEADLVSRLLCLDRWRILNNQFECASNMETENHYRSSPQAIRINPMSSQMKNYANVLHQYNYAPCPSSDNIHCVSSLQSSELQHQYQIQPAIQSRTAATTPSIAHQPLELPPPTTNLPDQECQLYLPATSVAGRQFVGGGWGGGGGSRNIELSDTRHRLTEDQEATYSQRPAIALPYPAQYDHQRNHQMHLQHYQNQQPQNPYFHEANPTQPRTIIPAEEYPFCHAPQPMCYHQQHHHHGHHSQHQLNCAAPFGHQSQNYYTNQDTRNTYCLPASYKQTNHPYYEVQAQHEREAHQQQTASTRPETRLALELPPSYSTIIDTHQQEAAPNSTQSFIVADASTTTADVPILQPTDFPCQQLHTNVAARGLQFTNETGVVQQQYQQEPQQPLQDRQQHQHEQSYQPHHQGISSFVVKFEKVPALGRAPCLPGRYPQHDHQEHQQQEQRAAQLRCTTTSRLASALAASRLTGPADSATKCKREGREEVVGSEATDEARREAPDGSARVRACQSGGAERRTGQSGSGPSGPVARRKNATRETTAMLKEWLDEHGQNPYPTKGEKIMLTILTKMSLTQVSTWFANARRRMKKDNKANTWATSSSNTRQSEHNHHQQQQQHCSQQEHQDQSYQQQQQQPRPCSSRSTSGQSSISPINSSSVPSRSASSSSGLDDKTCLIGSSVKPKLEQPSSSQQVHHWATATSTTTAPADSMAAPLNPPTEPRPHVSQPQLFEELDEID